MKKLFLILVLMSSPSVVKADPVFTVWAATHVAIMLHDAITTGVKLPTCDKARGENPSAYALTHGGWGNGNVNGRNLKICKEN